MGCRYGGYAGVGDFSGTLQASLLSLIAMPRPFKPTAEQQEIVDAVLGGANLKIKAYAGAGKTSTLRLIADRLAAKRGSYPAFNKEIAEHARRGFPPNVSARTWHSVAYASVSTALTSRVNLPAEPPHELAARYGLGPIEVPTITGKCVEVTPFELGRMITDGLGRFCRSAQAHPEPVHITVDEKIGTRRATGCENRCSPTWCACGTKAPTRAGAAQLRPTFI
jgi:hypothetical protein